MILPLGLRRSPLTGGVAFLLLASLAAPVQAAPPSLAQEAGSGQVTAADLAVGPLRIGTKEAAPFSFRGPDGEWAGVSIDLWRLVAADLGLEYEFREACLLYTSPSPRD